MGSECEKNRMRDWFAKVRLRIFLSYFWACADAPAWSLLRGEWIGVGALRRIHVTVGRGGGAGEKDQCLDATAVAAGLGLRAMQSTDASE